MVIYRNRSKKVARIRIAGPDKKGIIARVTGYLFEKGCNVEDIDQRILEGYLIMNMLVDYSDLNQPLKAFLSGLQQAANLVETEVEFKPEEKNKIKNVALLVSAEPHCLTLLADELNNHHSKGKIVTVIGNHPDLKPIVKKYNFPFHYIPSEKKKVHESKILALLKKYNTDLVVLARYMQILSPEFIFRYEGRIINIHPSLLPAFPGPKAYHQAFNKGVEIAGVTAHFVTTALDEGPIIAQESFRIDKTGDSVDKLIQKGKDLEAKVLARAVKLFLEDRLSLRRGKVIDSKKLRSLKETTEKFYQS